MRDELVQYLVVGPHASHEQVVTDVALASVGRMLATGIDQGTWPEFLDEAIAKRVKRCNRTKWDLIAALPGAYVHGCAIAFDPLHWDDVPEPVRKAAASHFDRERSGTPAERVGPGRWIIADAGLGMTTGKTAAQAAHALMLAVLDEIDVEDEISPEDEADLEEIDPDDKVEDLRPEAWEDVRFAELTSEAFRAAIERAAEVVEVEDAGRSEVEPGTTTACFVVIE